MIAALLPTSTAWPGLIDDFSKTEQFVQWSDVSTSAPDTKAVPGVFGDGYRTLLLEVTGNTDPGGAVTSTAVLPTIGRWQTENDDGVTSIASVEYASAGGATLLVGNPGTASDTLFRATVTVADNPLRLTASLVDDDSDKAFWTWDIPAIPPAGLVVSRLLSDFNFTLNDPLNVFNFSKVTAITVKLQAQSDGTPWDGSLGLLETTAVPEPSSLLLGLAVTGVVGFAAARRRRKQACMSVANE